jgi:hypothetical protein
VEYDPNYLADERFFRLVEMPAYRGGSLEVVSGAPARRSGFETPMIERLETAWRTPFADLRCSEVAGLLVQKMGLDWLAKPIVIFVRRYPDSDCGYYPGDMMANMLRAADDFVRHAQPEFGEWLAQDLFWLDDMFTWSRPFRRGILANLERARALQA